jgi:hypothetical protein
MRTPIRRYYHANGLVAIRDVQAGKTYTPHFDHQADGSFCRAQPIAKLAFVASSRPPRTETTRLA